MLQDECFLLLLVTHIDAFFVTIIYTFMLFEGYLFHGPIIHF